MIRDATELDAEILAEFRLAMSRDAGFLSEADDLTELQAATVRYMRDRVGSDAFRCWIAEVEGSPAASAGVIVRNGPPNLRDITGREAYLLNVYTLPEHRRKGLATVLTETVLEWCASQGIRKISLHATEDGARIYERFGFEEDSRAMVLRWNGKPLRGA